MVQGDYYKTTKFNSLSLIFIFSLLLVTSSFPALSQGFGVVSASSYTYSCDSLSGGKDSYPCHESQGFCKGPSFGTLYLSDGSKAYCCDMGKFINGQYEYHPFCGDYKCLYDNDCSIGKECLYGKCVDIRDKSTSCWYGSDSVDVGDCKIIDNPYGKYYVCCELVSGVPTGTTTQKVPDVNTCEGYSAYESDLRNFYTCRPFCLFGESDVTDLPDAYCGYNTFATKCCFAESKYNDPDFVHDVEDIREHPKGNPSFCMTNEDCYGFKVKGVLYQHCMDNECKRLPNEPGPTSFIHKIGEGLGNTLGGVLGGSVQGISSGLFSSLGFSGWIFLIIIFLFILFVVLKKLGVL